MSDLTECPKCGKQTNKYSLHCEHCFEPLKQEAAVVPPVFEAKEELKQKTIQEPIKEPAQEQPNPKTIMPFSLKRCPFCAEEIQAEAVKCRYCGELMKKPSKTAINYKLVLTALLAVAGIAIALLLIYAGLAHLPGVNFGMDPLGKKIGRLSDELKSDPAKAEYVKNNIALSDIGTLDETDPRSAAVSKYVYGTLKNSGNKLIIKLKINVYYLDKNGKCTAEGSVWPILGAKGKPDSLKPNSSKDFQVLITSVSPEWSRRIKAKVADIELLD